MLSYRIAIAVGLVAAAAACSTTVTTFQGDGGSGGTPSSSSNNNASSSSNSATSSSSSSSSAAGGAGMGFGACTTSFECTLAAPGCCGVCGEPRIDDLVPINEANAAAFFDATCDEVAPICPDCIEGYNPYLFAYCEAGQCAAADTRNELWNECADASDCTLRVGTDCCESCTLGDQSNLIAVPIGEGGLTNKVCDGEPSTCPPCAPTYPSGAVPLCDAGVCVVGWTN